MPTKIVKNKKDSSAPRKRVEPIVIKGVRLIYRNFSGAPGIYNAAGNRHFSIVLTDELADNFTSAGFKVKYTKPREAGDKAIPYLGVKVQYNANSRPPRVVIIQNGRQRDLDESTIGILDWATIVEADLSIIPYHWEVRSETGIKAYLKALYVTLELDELEEKYAPTENKQTTPMTSD